jgi:hypothetical protein
MAYGDQTGGQGMVDPGRAEAAPDGFTPAHRAALGARQVDQDRTLAAVHELEAALASAGPGREGPWRAVVVAALDVLAAATAEEDRNAAQPDSLLADIARTQPRLRTRVRGLRTQYRHLLDSLDRFRTEFVDPDPDVVLDVADVRQRLAWLLGALRHQRARESDLIYEAYYEAFDRDLEDDAGLGQR